MSGIYVASRAKHARMWRRYRDRGHLIISTWIDEDGEIDDLARFWDRCLSEVQSCGAVVAYHEPDEIWKGALVEIGAALVSGAPVFVAGNPPGSWAWHPLVRRVASPAAGLQAAQLVIETNEPQERV